MSDISRSIFRTGLAKIRRMVRRDNFAPSPMSWSGLPVALKRVHDVQVNFKTVIDVGASDGQWSRVAHTVFPDARYVLIEMNEVHLAALTEYGESIGAEVIPVAAADHDGDVYFEPAADIYGGRAVNESRGILTSTPARRLDTLASERGWTPPYLIKLDTHGFEIEIVNGAAGILADTSVAIIEAYNFKLSDTSVRFHELCAYMQDQGFRCFDIFDPLHREKDGALWQFDMVFLRADLPTLNIPGYH